MVTESRLRAQGDRPRGPLGAGRRAAGSYPRFLLRWHTHALPHAAHLLRWGPKLLICQP